MKSQLAYRRNGRLWKRINRAFIHCASAVSSKIIIVSSQLQLYLLYFFYNYYFYCCGATEGSEQQHNQNLKEIYKGARILEFITFYLNALHLTTLFTTMHCI